MAGTPADSRGWGCDNIYIILVFFFLLTKSCFGTLHEFLEGLPFKMIQKSTNYEIT